MKKLNSILMATTLILTSTTFASEYKCNDSKATVVQYSKNDIVIGGALYVLENGVSATDDYGVYVMVNDEVEGKLDIDFQDVNDHGDRVDQWSCDLIK